MPSSESAHADAPGWNFNSDYHDLPVHDGAKVSDFLQKAIDSQSILAREPLSDKNDSQTREAADQTKAAQAARAKLAEEALLVDPEKLHKAFDNLMVDLKRDDVIDENKKWLNLEDIDKALKTDRVSADDRNTLTVLKAGFKVLDHGTDASLDSQNHAYETMQISDDSLSILETAFHPQMEDKYFTEIGLIRPAELTIATAILMGGYAYIKTRDGKASLLAAGAGALGGLGSGLLTLAKYEWMGGKEEMYGDLKQNYLTFESAFAKPEQPGPNENQGKHK